MRDYWTERYARVPGLRTVGSLSRSERENREDYGVARALLADTLRRDFADPSAISVLDLGFGRAYDATVLRELGVGRYLGLDFVAPTPAGFPPGFEFRTADFGARLDLGERFDLVLVIDVAFHLIDDTAFAGLVDNMARHARGLVYLTGLFHDEQPAPHVKHRPMEAFAAVGAVASIHPWRDTLLARLRAGGPGG